MCRVHVCCLRVSHKSTREYALATHKYMDIISRVLARQTTSNLIVMDRPCLQGHQVKKGEDSTYMQIRS